MRKYLLFLSLVSLCFACESEGELTKAELGSIPVTPESVLRYSGTFTPMSGINVTGFARIYQDGEQFKVSLENFTISGGPDLKVYLATSESPEVFINLGALGNGMLQTYAIPANVDFSLYNHVLIHCQQYNHLYAIALLESN